jgi:hypothetical protein
MSPQPRDTCLEKEKAHGNVDVGGARDHRHRRHSVLYDAESVTRPFRTLSIKSGEVLLPRVGERLDRHGVAGRSADVGQ